MFSSEERRAVDANEEVRVLLVACFKIVTEYGEILEKHLGDATRPMLLPETLLPYPKKAIARAITIVQRAISNPSLHPVIRQIMEPETARHILSPDYVKALDHAFALLVGLFVPPAEAEAWEEVYSRYSRYLEELGPDARAKYGDLFGGRQTPGDKK
jgi:hypothetical protein